MGQQQRQKWCRRMLVIGSCAVLFLAGSVAVAEENPEKSEQATDRAETFRAPIQQEAARKIIRNFDRVQADAAETRRQAEQQISEDK